MLAKKAIKEKASYIAIGSFYISKLKPKAKISFITSDKYSFTLASSCIGNDVVIPVLSNDKKNFIAKGIIK